jgi:hypothetical protein
LTKRQPVGIWRLTAYCQALLPLTVKLALTPGARVVVVTFCVVVVVGELVVEESATVEPAPTGSESPLPHPAASRVSTSVNSERRRMTFPSRWGAEAVRRLIAVSIGRGDIDRG